MELLQPYLPGFWGGCLIGLAATLLLVLNGRIAGISGIFFSIADISCQDRGWRAMFIAGMILGGFVFHSLTGAPIPLPAVDNPWLVAAAGLLVGAGTHTGSGCTSGHGVCGLARLSKRCFAATCTFMLFGMISTFVSRHLLG